jgi:5-(carboxyamino)imidazole ribonucleotide synthase
MKTWYSNNFKVGILGGGQLGRMLLQESPNIDVRLCIMDKDPEAPAARMAHEFCNEDIQDYDAVLAFGQDKDVITVEIENVNIEALEALEKQGKKVFPQPRVLRIIKDKGLQKQFYADHNIPTAPFYLCENAENFKNHITKLPVVQKLRVGGYDGRGVQIIKCEEDFDKLFDEPNILEDKIDFEKEISVIVARNESGQISHFPVVECEFNPEANLVEFLFSPALISEAIEEEAISIAKKTIEALDMVGLLAVEMFITKQGKVLVNEAAPRPHNSGHHTIECNTTSQFGQHLRAILNLPLGSTKLVRPGVMINLLGAEGHSGAVHYENIEHALAIPGVFIHLYGKTSTKPFRKMGHVTSVGRDLNAAIKKAKEVQSLIRVISKP